MRDPRARITVARILFAAVILHLGFLILRIPRLAWQKRAEKIASYQEQGATRFHLSRTYPEVVTIIEWLLENTDPDCAVLYRAPTKGAMEFLPALLFPRLLVTERERGAPPELIEKRSFARGRHPEAGEGILILVEDENGLRLETL